MKRVWTSVVVVAFACVVATSLWQRYAQAPAEAPALASTRPAQAEALRIGIIPERDIFAQRKRYQVLADYLAMKLGREVRLVTVNSYEAVLQDFAEKEVDAAFLGSLVAVLTMDRLGGQVLAKPEMEGGVSTYRGAIFVPKDSPITSVEDLAGRSIALVRTTTGGNLFPMAALHERGLLKGPQAPRIVWVGTHDEAVLEVASGRLDAGGVKDLRLFDFERQHPETSFRILATSEPVPENALIVRADLAGSLGPTLMDLLLTMEVDAQGRKALAAFGATRFLRCRSNEFETICNLVSQLGESWADIGVKGPPPGHGFCRPATSPAEAEPSPAGGP